MTPDTRGKGLSSKQSEIHELRKDLAQAGETVPPKVRIEATTVPPKAKPASAI